MAKNNLTIYKSNKVVEAGYKLNLNEQRLILSCIAKVNSNKPLLATERFEVTAKEFAQLFKISEDKAYQTLKDTATQLFERYVIIDNPDPTDKTLKYTKTRWVSAVNYHPDAGKVSLLFAPLLLPYLSELQGQFTFYLLENISAMNSIHAIRLYELLIQWKTTGNREIEIDWLKKQFELEDKYNSIKDLKKYVIDPAVKDINTHSNYEVSWTQRKTGRKVTHLTFEFSEKKSPTPLKKVISKTKSTKKTTVEVKEEKIDNLEYFAQMRKKYKGKFNEKSVPQDIVEKLKTQGRW
jgi:plasmid replication initiation protein